MQPAFEKLNKKEPVRKWKLKNGVWTREDAQEQDIKSVVVEHSDRHSYHIFYTDAEYSKLLHSADWNKADTDRLCQLWNDCGARMPVIWDRFNQDHQDNVNAFRTVEEMQERLVEIINKLADSKNATHIRPTYDKGKTELL